MRGQHMWISCDYEAFRGHTRVVCDEEFEQDGFMRSETGRMTWTAFENHAREEGWTVKRGKHFCPHHSDHKAF